MQKTTPATKPLDPFIVFVSASLTILFILGSSSTCIIIGILTAIFTLSIYTGLQKGVKLMGDINIRTESI